ncbi:hypothetical protein D043_5277A, partial [Vibrio parahaemolyticus EKP-021]
MINNF